MQLGHMLSTTFTRPVVHMSRKYMHKLLCIVGKFGGRGYVRWPTKMHYFAMFVGCATWFWSQFFANFDSTYESLRCLDLKIWLFVVDEDDNNDTTDYFTLVHAHGVKVHITIACDDVICCMTIILCHIHACMCVCVCLISNFATHKESHKPSLPNHCH